MPLSKVLSWRGDCRSALFPHSIRGSASVETFTTWVRNPRCKLFLQRGRGVPFGAPIASDAIPAAVASLRMFAAGTGKFPTYGGKQVDVRLLKTPKAGRGEP